MDLLIVKIVISKSIHYTDIQSAMHDDLVTVVFLLLIIINVGSLIVDSIAHQKSKFHRILYAFKSSSNHNVNSNGKSEGSRITDDTQGTIRLNKCLNSLSRRASDDAIAEGRVTINNKIAKAICFLNIQYYYFNL